jgi:hypothetical protein
VLDQAPDVTGVGLEPTIVVLRPVEFAAGEAASVVANDRVVRRQMSRHRFEDIGFAIGPRDHEHERAAAVALVVEPGAGNFEDTHV